MDQYFSHSRISEDWGLDKLYERIDHEMSDVPSMLQNDLELEMQVVANLKTAIAICEEAGDYQTRNIFEQMLKDTEEEHAHWLETQLGLQNYLQSQM